MKWLQRLFLALLVLTSATVLMSDPAAAASNGIVGDWDGTLLAGVLKLRLVLHIDAAGSGTIVSVDQGNVVLPLSRVGLAGDTVSFVLDKPSASFQGKLAADGSTINGTWSQAGGNLPLTFARRAPGAAAPALNRPQEPHVPYPYRSEDVTYDGPAGKLAGTLTMPGTGGPFAAAVLVAGSGPHDRDETVFGHKPFLVLSDYLTRHGIAVLRSDKRGSGQSTGNGATATTEDFAADVRAAIAYLRTRKEIGKKIGLIGHSEGGIIAPMVAAKDHSVAFVVLMAGPGLRGDEILMLQGQLIMQAMGAPKEQLDRNDAIERQVLDAVISAPNLDEARARAKTVLANSGLGLTDPAVAARVDALTSPWFRFFLTYDPAPALTAVQCPVLAINGEKDTQVAPEQDLAAIKAALAGNPHATTLELPGLNHLFQTAKTGAPTEYGDIEETIAPVALDTVATWIGQQIYETDTR